MNGNTVEDFVATISKFVSKRQNIKHTQLLMLNLTCILNVTPAQIFVLPVHLKITQFQFEEPQTAKQY